jgi:hypothetical protein
MISLRLLRGPARGCSKWAPRRGPRAAAEDALSSAPATPADAALDPFIPFFKRTFADGNGLKRQGEPGIVAGAQVVGREAQFHYSTAPSHLKALPAASVVFLVTATLLAL